MKYEVVYHFQCVRWVIDAPDEECAKLWAENQKRAMGGFGAFPPTSYTVKQNEE